MSNRLTCWHIEDAAEYETTQEWSGPCYVFFFEYRNHAQQETYVAQFLTEKLITTMGSLCFALVAECIEEKTGVLDLTSEEVVEAFRLSRPAAEYEAWSKNEK